MLNLKPYGEHILVELAEGEAQTKTPSGIIIPDTADKDRMEKGTIIDVGEGGRNKKGEVVPIRAKAGQKICFSKPYSADKIESGDKKYLFIKEEDILAIIQ